MKTITTTYTKNLTDPDWGKLNEMLAEIQYKTLLYRYFETPTAVLLGVSAIAILAPPMVSVVALVVGAVLVTVDFVVYGVRFRSLPSNENINPPSERRLTIHRFAVILSLVMVMFRAGAIAYM